jgi:hypothetical protein
MHVIAITISSDVIGRRRRRIRRNVDGGGCGCVVGGSISSQ